MKKTIRIYLNTILLFFVPFVLFSFILAVLSYFMQINALFMNIGVQVIAYLFLFISAMYFTAQIPSKRISHCLCITLIYFLVSLLIHLGNLSYIHLFLKSLIFIFIGIYKELRDSKLKA
ncbi:MAG: DUF3792 domain-containing protein [Coprobacillus sp.]